MSDIRTVPPKRASYLFGRAPAVKIYARGMSGWIEMLMNQRDPFDRPDCRMVKSERKVKVGFIRMCIGGKVKTVYVKQHNALSLGHRLASLFLASAAIRSLSGALTLLDAGYATAEPIAAVEYRNWGVLIKSLYFAEELAGTKTVSAFWREDLAALKGLDGYRKRRAFLRELARLLSSLHAKRLYHNDLKAANLLIRASAAPPYGVFNIIDLQGMRQCLYVSKRRRIKNLAQLNRTLGILLNKTEKLFFLSCYNHASGWRKTNKELIAIIWAETQRQIARERARRNSPLSVFETTYEPSSLAVQRTWFARADEDQTKPLITTN
jgi:hypothetical protein